MVKACNFWRSFRTMQMTVTCVKQLFLPAAQRLSLIVRQVLLRKITFVTIDVKSNFIGTRSLKKSLETQPYSRESAINQKVKQFSEIDSKQRSLLVPMRGKKPAQVKCCRYITGKPRQRMSACVACRCSQESSLILVPKLHSSPRPSTF